MFLELQQVKKSFGGLVAIDSLDASIYEGEILGLIGPNGSGKTTLFNLITGFLKPESGSIWFQGGAITGLRPHKVCEMGIARTFQLVKPFAALTAVQNVAVGRIYGRDPARSLSQAEDESRAILHFVGLGGKAGKIAGALTLPDRKRLELARALATRPRLLLLDEMMAGLNPVEADAAVDLIIKIKDSGVAIMMVEHNMRVVLAVSNRVLVISYGTKIAEGLPTEIVEDPQVIAAYLGEP